MRTNTRTEKVSAEHGGEECPGPASVDESCNVHECPGYKINAQYLTMIECFLNLMIRYISI